MGWTGLMFSTIAGAYERGAFGRIGPALWRTAAGDTELVPFCSMRVDKSYQTIRRTAFPLEWDLAAWLDALAGDASALAPGWEGRAASASRALTLVTCSSARAGMRDRTLLVFVS